MFVFWTLVLCDEGISHAVLYPLRRSESGGIDGRTETYSSFQSSDHGGDGASESVSERSSMHLPTARAVEAVDALVGDVDVDDGNTGGANRRGSGNQPPSREPSPVVVVDFPYSSRRGSMASEEAHKLATELVTPKRGRSNPDAWPWVHPVAH